MRLGGWDGSGDGSGDRGGGGGGGGGGGSGPLNTHIPSWPPERRSEAPPSDPKSRSPVSRAATPAVFCYARVEREVAHVS